jgi:hypothetical protein
MQLELSETDVRLVRSLLVRHLVELEEELARTKEAPLLRALGARLNEVRDLHDRLTSNLEPPSRSLQPPSAVGFVPA